VSIFVDQLAVYGRASWHPRPQQIESAIVAYNYQPVFIISSICSLLLLSMAIVAIYFFLRYKRLGRFLTLDEIKEFKNGRPRHENASRNSQTECAPEFSKFDAAYDLSMSELSVGV